MRAQTSVSLSFVGCLNMLVKGLFCSIGFEAMFIWAIDLNFGFATS